jgi:hypothetical protein
MTVHEKLKERFIHTPGRTDNRIRSPRFVASSFWNNVSKGSRQIRSVTLGKGLALRAGLVEFVSEELSTLQTAATLRGCCGL